MSGNMPAVIGAEQVHAALPWSTLAHGLRAAFVSPDAPTAPTRHAHALDGANHEHLLLMPAWNARFVGVKLVTVLPDAPRHGGRTVEASYLLCDRLTGAPRALLDGEALTLRRTAAVSALAARELARTDSRTLLVIGTGRLAPWLVRAHVALRPTLERVLVWGRSPARVAETRRQLQDLGVPVVAADDLTRAVPSADIISCATTSQVAVLHGAWLSPGTHVDLVGAYTPLMRETDDAVIARSRVFVDDMASAMTEAGDVLQAIASGAVAVDHVRGDLYALLSGRVAGRTGADDITCFKSVGLALEDLVAASLVYDHLSSSLSPT
ncbi:MAG: ornithine cyclodeaminase [Gemmatimonas sp.]|uniref:ornithine cyclodeaminase family protein n=1 Tax=Gemmatimonas sp. UBA7669 TaxID=1946568 RepID=UPI0025C34C0B|nr:ornithine cyclodeaminase family protein [Gemmatimonas sp. UBA7669]MBA3919669.1 ornithine cyclodeaminase [Gemmatimonas sp.]